MNSNTKSLISAMRPNGKLHLGHYFGALVQWKQVQYEYDCLFMIADVNSWLNNYQSCQTRHADIEHMIISWLASGIDPSQAIIFIQSQIPEQYELMVLLSAISPLTWLERVPCYKEQIDLLTGSELNSLGLLSSTLMQSSDILLYNTRYVLAHEEQIPNLELSRELARRFNHLFGREDGFENKALESIKKLGQKKASLYESLLVQYQQNGNEEALEKARFLLTDAINLSYGDRERLFAFLENKGKVFLNEAQLLSTPRQKILGLDGLPMNNLLNNTIELLSPEAEVASKVRSMRTDPARVRRTDRGNPQNCPVWTLHQVYSNSDIKDWAEIGCLSAGIGCLDCKQPLIDEINKQQQQLLHNAQPYLDDPTLVKRIITDGCLRARDIAHDNLQRIKQVIKFA
ncbi:MAG: hypothetical protein RLZZ293_20 [Pseudomonadota bacterium]|jgi:tryptophanyl-tRNA synthetase